MLCHKMSEVLVTNAFLGQSEMSRKRSSLFVCELCAFVHFFWFQLLVWTCIFN